MSSSLRDQLIQAGLATEKQGKQIGHQQRQRGIGQRQPAQADHQKQAARRAQADKAARDQELNRQQQIKAEKKARMAEIRQMIEQARLPKLESDDRFNFVDERKIRSVPVDAALRDRLNRGELAIARCDRRYEIVPAEAAARIRERAENAIIKLPEVAPATDEVNDPYKDFPVPDDLTW